MDDKLFKIMCELVESNKQLVDRLNPGTGTVKPNVYPTTFNGDAPQEIARENPRRVEIWIHNADDTNDLFLAPDVPEIGGDLYSLVVAPNDTIIMNGNNYSLIYRKKIVGFWESGVSNDAKAMITEFSIQ
jgi:hypothetical protein